MNRSMGIVLSALLSGCAAPMASMQPLELDGLVVVYQKGVPVALSRASKSSVIVAPVTNETGRYQIGDRVSFLVLVRNESGEKVEIAEDSFTLIANRTRARTVTAVEMKDAIQRDAVWAHAANGFSAVLSSMGATVNGSTANVTVRDSGEAQRGPREIARDHAQAAAPITAREQDAASSLARMLQRSTLLPGAGAGGFVVMEVPRAAACISHDHPAPCHFILTAYVAGELHSFVFDEAFSGD